MLYYFLPVAIKVGQLIGIVDEFDEGDGLAVLVVVYGLELSPCVVGDEFSIGWSDVGVKQLHVAVVGDGVVLEITACSITLLCVQNKNHLWTSRSVIMLYL